MKNLVSITMLAACLLTLAQATYAQDCSSWTNYDLRGTYAMTGSGWIDLSKVVASLPAGTIPMSFVGAKTFNGLGGGAGWVTFNAGGAQFTADFVNLTYQVKSDCSVTATYSLKIRELGITVGPVSRVLVVGGTWAQLELLGIQAGAGPGTQVDNIVERRFSMQH